MEGEFVDELTDSLNLTGERYPSHTARMGNTGSTVSSSTFVG